MKVFPIRMKKSGSKITVLFYKWFQKVFKSRRYYRHRWSLRNALRKRLKLRKRKKRYKNFWGKGLRYFVRRDRGRGPYKRYPFSAKLKVKAKTLRRKAKRKQKKLLYNPQEFSNVFRKRSCENQVRIFEFPKVTGAKLDILKIKKPTPKVPSLKQKIVRGSTFKVKNFYFKKLYGSFGKTPSNFFNFQKPLWLLRLLFKNERLKLRRRGRSRYAKRRFLPRHFYYNTLFRRWKSRRKQKSVLKKTKPHFQRHKVGGRLKKRKNFIRSRTKKCLWKKKRRRSFLRRILKNKKLKGKAHKEAVVKTNQTKSKAILKNWRKKGLRFFTKKPWKKTFPKHKNFQKLKSFGGWKRKVSAKQNRRKWFYQVRRKNWYPAPLKWLRFYGVQSLMNRKRRRRLYFTKKTKTVHRFKRRFFNAWCRRILFFSGRRRRWKNRFLKFRAYCRYITYYKVPSIAVWQLSSTLSQLGTGIRNISLINIFSTSRALKRMSFWALSKQGELGDFLRRTKFFKYSVYSVLLHMFVFTRQANSNVISFLIGEMLARNAAKKKQRALIVYFRKLQKAVLMHARRYFLKLLVDPVILRIKITGKLAGSLRTRNFFIGPRHLPLHSIAHPIETSQTMVNTKYCIFTVRVWCI